MRHFYFPLSLLLPGVLACTAQEPFEPEADVLSFRVSIAPVPATRSDAVTLADSPAGEVEAFLRPMSPEFGDDSLSTRGVPVTSMYDRFSFLSDTGLRGTAVRSGDRYQVGGLQYYALPRDEGNRFYCWGPSDGAGISETDGKLHYSAPSDVSQQPDLVVAVSPAMGRLDKGPTPLTFAHALAGLQVNAGSVFPGCRINSLTLHGVSTDGTYDLAGGGWTLAEAVADFTLLPKTGSVSAGSPLTDEAWTAMLVPQTFSSEASLSLSLTYDGRVFDYTVPLEGLTLRAGCILTVGIGCRSLYLFEGTASGPFSVYYFKGVASGTSIYSICDVPVDEDGSFSVLVPALSTSNQNHSYSFARNGKLLTVTRLPDILETRQSYCRMFQNCSALKGIYCDIPHGKVTNWNWAFYNCQSLKDLPEEIETAGGTTFNSMFYGCKSLQAAPRMDTSAGTDFGSLFRGCSALKTVPEYDLARGTDFSSMFNGCKALTELPAYRMPRGTNFNSFCKDCVSLKAVPDFYTAAGTKFGYAFSGCTSLTDVAPIDTGKGTDFTAMFQDCTSLVTIPLLDTSRGTVFREMFHGCTKLTGLPLLDTSRGTTFYEMFCGCKSLSACPELDTSSATTLYAMFEDCTALQETWPYATSRTTNFSRMFFGCTVLSRVDAFDTAAGTVFNQMFQGCKALTAVPAFPFAAGSTNNYMFAHCSSLAGVPDWDWSHMTSCAHMFDSCTSLREIGTRVNTSSCTNFTGMFQDCSALRRVESMDVGAMVTGSLLFYKCSSLKEAPVLEAPSATDIIQMFDGCQSLASVPRLSFPNGGSWYAVFRNCQALQSVSGVDFTGATSMSECFLCDAGRGGLTSLPAIPASTWNNAESFLTGQGKLVDAGGFPGIRVSFNLSDCTSLSRESLLAVIEGLAEVSGSCSLTLGETLLGKLTDEELQAAADKGWTVR